MNKKAHDVPAITDVIGWHIKECQVWSIMLTLSQGDRSRAIACWEEQIAAIGPPPDPLGLRPKGYG